MKKYIKPSIEVLAVETVSQLLQSSGLEIHNGTGDGSGQLSRRKKDIVVDDEDEDDDGFGW